MGSIRLLERSSLCIVCTYLSAFENRIEIAAVRSTASSQLGRMPRTSTTSRYRKPHAFFTRRQFLPSCLSKVIDKVPTILRVREQTEIFWTIVCAWLKDDIYPASGLYTDGSPRVVRLWIFGVAWLASASRSSMDGTIKQISTLQSMSEATQCAALVALVDTCMGDRQLVGLYHNCCPVADGSEVDI
jgi:hypothetical protein